MIILDKRLNKPFVYNYYLIELFTGYYFYCNK